MLAEAEEDGGSETFLFFYEHLFNERVKQYMDNPKACIYFYHKGLIKFVGVMLKAEDTIAI